jgi:hypothetical protein
MSDRSNYKQRKLFLKTTTRTITVDIAKPNRYTSYEREEINVCIGLKFEV